ncbi:MAG TPA: hypothetical protein VJ732_16100 [Bryobacteraceae bacterium]|nr:hypothetical protein [Bryobacteraceae bacterium]
MQATDPNVLRAAMEVSATLLYGVAGVVVLIGMILVALPARVFARKGSEGD